MAVHNVDHRGIIVTELMDAQFNQWYVNNMAGCTEHLDLTGLNGARLLALFRDGFYYDGSSTGRGWKMPPHDGFQTSGKFKPLTRDMLNTLPALMEHDGISDTVIRVLAWCLQDYSGKMTNLAISDLPNLRMSWDEMVTLITVDISVMTELVPDGVNPGYNILMAASKAMYGCVDLSGTGVSQKDLEDMMLMVHIKDQLDFYPIVRDLKNLLNAKKTYANLNMQMPSAISAQAQANIKVLSELDYMANSLAAMQQHLELVSRRLRF